ncbi:hypothetical protein KI440_00375 [Candidatus Saccharibacteria bacterium TM7i]|nr:hypothetical protein KI440_00375 [Candidatus Saccharibacteria bacterium TM7i]
MKKTVTLLTVVLSFASVVFFGSLVGAVTSSGGAQPYKADGKIDNGTIVQLTTKDSGRVKVAKQQELQNMFGVTIDRGLLPFTMSNEGSEGDVYVAASGTYNVLVSTQAGVIKSGDYITLSAIDGIGMKAGTEEKTVFGRANAGFDGTGVVLGTVTLKDVNGKENDAVKIGTIPVTINIQRNPNIKSTKTKVPEFLERIGQAIAEKEVSALRIYLSLGITAVSIIAAIAILYAGVRNSVISIGRNPMSKKSVFRALMEIILTSILILVIGLFAVYLLLRL